MPGVVLAVDTGGVIVPGLIIAGCAFVSTVAIVVRRGQGRAEAAAGGDDAVVPAEAEASAEGSATDVRSAGAPDWGRADTDLLAWQQHEGRHVDAWIDAHERTLPELRLGADPAIDAAVDEAMGNAASVCPNPEVSAMLHGMQHAARATRAAIAGGDREAATEAHSTYARHRSGAVAAMNGATRDEGAPPT